MQQRRFFLLSEPLPASHIPKMLCRVVSDKHFPLQDYAPRELIPDVASNEPSHSTNDILPSILPSPSISARSEVLRNAKNKSISASLTALFGFDLATEREDLVKLESEEVKRYALSNPRDYFEKLMENELYKRDVEKLLRENGRRQAYLVTGFLTTQGALWTFTDSKSRSGGLEVSVPVNEMLAAPVPLPGFEDPKIAAAGGISAGRTRKMRVVEEEIFAVAYSVVKWTSTISSSAPHVSYKAVLKAPARVKGKHHGFGEDEEEEEEEEEEEAEAINREKLEVLENTDSEEGIDF